MARVKVEGLGKLDRKLGRLVDRVSDDKAITRALETAAAPIAARASADAPKRTGELSRDVEVEVVGERQVAVQPRDAFWGFFQEMGTRFQPPQPFLLPAFHGGERRAREIFRRLMKLEVEREARRG